MIYLLFLGDLYSDCGFDVTSFRRGFSSLDEAKNNAENVEAAIILVLKDGLFSTSFVKGCGYSGHLRDWHEHKSLTWYENNETLPFPYP